MDHLARRHPVRLTPQTIADQAGLFRSIANGGPRSVQFDWQEHSPREVCVAVPLGFGQAEALALSLPASQLHRRTTPPPHNATASRKPPRPPPDQTPTAQTATVLLSLLISGNPPVEPAPPRHGEIAAVPPPTDCSSHDRPPSRCRPDRHPTGPKPHSDVCAGPRGRRSP
ncbi:MULTISPECIES: hypothetical protein [unclassified Streptomyces]|uniref:hypothetical protein n=1 Tax=unclassified Streptomyces TaxID=2593676 RepID=UPI0035DDCE03